MVSQNFVAIPLPAIRRSGVQITKGIAHMPRPLRPALLALALTSAFICALLAPPAQAATTKPKIGASASDNTSFNALNSKAGPLAARRTFNSTLPSSFAKSLAGLDVTARRVSYWSFKPNVKTFASDTSAQSAFSAFLDTIPAGHQTVVVAWHEPEDEIRSGAFTLSQWGATNTRLGQIIDSKRRPELRLGICLMGPWTFDSRSPYYSYKWESAVDFRVVDVVGIDPYKFRTESTSLQQMLTKANSGSGSSNPSTMQKLASWGKPVALMEFGVVSKDRYTGAAISDATRATWITEAYAWMKSWNAGTSSPKIEAALYWNLSGAYLSGQALTAFSNAAIDSRR
jgi:hypothetical protein